MAAPPRERQWTVEPPPDSGDWFSEALPQIQSFISAVTFALTAQLSRADNFRSQKKTLSINTANDPNFPYTFDCTLGAVPEEIRVAQVKIITPGGIISEPMTCTQWELIEGAKIRIHNITGLAANTKYEITLIVE